MRRVNKMKRGLDVSSHNGNVDWQAVKNAGYGDFAIIRLGIGSDYANQDDAQYERNISECERLGIPY
jgi:GH25 family lysozyme M1 (1,4-beta-N-acetylmuramidase)